MGEPRDAESELIEAVEHPVETVEEGKSPWTPFVALSGITVFVAVIIVVLLVIAFGAYYIAR